MKAASYKADADALAKAYDSVAEVYDGLVEEDLWMRRVLWQRYSKLFVAGDRVLDVACGTGLDTVFLAHRDVRVTGFDVSAGMIETLREKIECQGLSGRIETRVQDASGTLPWESESFDGIVSAFAGLNTVSELRVFSANANRVLRTGGRLLFHMLAPSGIWSRLWLLARLQWDEARALKLRRRFIKKISGREIQHNVLPAVEIYREFFESYFDLTRAYGLGFLWPQKLGNWIPMTVAYSLGLVETYAGRSNICLDWGRFFVLEMEKRYPVKMPDRG